MSRSHLHRARAERGVNRLIWNNRYLAPDHGQDSDAPDQIFVACIFGIDGNGSITEDRLRTCCGNADVLWPLVALNWFERVAHKGQCALRIDMVHLKVGEGAHATRTPVDDAFATVDQPFLIKAHKNL